MKIALLCSGLGNIQRGHETFAQDLFNLVSDTVDITLFKGGGEDSPKEKVIGNIPRNAACLDHIHVAAASKWTAAIQEQERIRIESETFAYAALQPLIEGEFEVIHCLEKDVCNIIYDHRYLFRYIPKIVFSNGGAIPAWDLPRCDFVHEYTEHNLRYSAGNKAFVIPHGVDLNRFNPHVESSFRKQYGIPDDAFCVISVGVISQQHKRMDYVIKETSLLQDARLIIVGQDASDTPAIKDLGKRLLGDKVIFTKLPHDELPKAYAAADVFVLGSLFETFGIVYIEALAMGLPVICAHHPNQRSIVKEGIFIDMKKTGALTDALRNTDRSALAALAQRSQEIAVKYYDFRVLKQQYIERYRAIASVQVSLPRYSFKAKLTSNLKNAFKKSVRMIFGQAE